MSLHSWSVHYRCGVPTPGSVIRRSIGRPNNSKRFRVHCRSSIQISSSPPYGGPPSRQLRLRPCSLRSGLQFERMQVQTAGISIRDVWKNCLLVCKTIVCITNADDTQTFKLLHKTTKSGALVWPLTDVRVEIDGAATFCIDLT